MESWIVLSILEVYTCSRNGSLDTEISRRIAKARLTGMVTYSERFNQNCIRRILNIEWRSYTPDTVVLERACSINIEKRLILNQMCWVGHVVKMEDERLPKQLFYGELTRGKRPQYKPRERFKDVLKSNLKELEINVDDWEALTEIRASWRKLIRERCSNFEQKRVEYAALKRAPRKQDDSAVPTDVLNELKCSVCRRLLLSMAGLVNHLKSHGLWPNEAVYEEAPALTSDKTHLSYRWLSIQVGWRFD